MVISTAIDNLLHIHTFCDSQQLRYRVIRADQHKTDTFGRIALNPDHFCVVSNLCGSAGTAQNGPKFCGRTADIHLEHFFHRGGIGYIAFVGKIEFTP